MQIQVHTDNHVKGDVDLAGYVEDSVAHALGRYEPRITRVEVHLAGENSRHKIADKNRRCVMEARVAGRKPVAVRHHAATVKEAFDGAAEKMLHSLEHTFGRLHDRRPKAVADGTLVNKFVSDE